MLVPATWLQHTGIYVQQVCGPRMQHFHGFQHSRDDALYGAVGSWGAGIPVSKHPRVYTVATCMDSRISLTLVQHKPSR
jgi:hypothetical protein